MRVSCKEEASRFIQNCNRCSVRALKKSGTHEASRAQLALNSLQGANFKLNNPEARFNLKILVSLLVIRDTREDACLISPAAGGEEHAYRDLSAGRGERLSIGVVSNQHA